MAKPGHPSPPAPSPAYSPAGRSEWYRRQVPARPSVCAPTDEGIHLLGAAGQPVLVRGPEHADGGVGGAGAAARRDAAHVPRAEGGAQHHRRHQHDHCQHAHAPARGRLLAAGAERTGRTQVPGPAPTAPKPPSPGPAGGGPGPGSGAPASPERLPPGAGGGALEMGGAYCGAGLAVERWLRGWVELELWSHRRRGLNSGNK